MNLLRHAEYLKFKSHPKQFGEEVEFAYKQRNIKLFVVDEIQKIPELLDETHLLIEEYKDIRFILTGSSARKLKKRLGSIYLEAERREFIFIPLFLQNMDLMISRKI